jgi:hypothetical protein
MITFQEFLTESRSAPLYHATTAVNADRILHADVMLSTTQDNGQAKGQKVIFVTRNLAAAKRYINYSNAAVPSVIFVLDQSRLTHRYRIKPIKNWQDEREDHYAKTSDQINNLRMHLPMSMTGQLGANEFEEVIHTDRITNFGDYVTDILTNAEVDHRKYKSLASDPRTRVSK